MMMKVKDKTIETLSKANAALAAAQAAVDMASEAVKVELKGRTEGECKAGKVSIRPRVSVDTERLQGTFKAVWQQCSHETKLVDVTIEAKGK